MTGHMVFVLVFAVLLLATWSYLERRKRRTRIERFFADRQDLTMEDAYRQLYESLGLPRDSIEEALELLSKNVGFPPGLLRPEDRFSVELAEDRPWLGLDTSLSDLTWETGWLLKRYGVHWDPTGIQTVGDYVMVVARALSRDKGRVSGNAMRNSLGQAASGESGSGGLDSRHVPAIGSEQPCLVLRSAHFAE